MDWFLGEACGKDEVCGEGVVGGCSWGPYRVAGLVGGLLVGGVHGAAVIDVWWALSEPGGYVRPGVRWGPYGWEYFEVPVNRVSAIGGWVQLGQRGWLIRDLGHFMSRDVALRACTLHCYLGSSSRRDFSPLGDLPGMYDSIQFSKDSLWLLLRLNVALGGWGYVPGGEVPSVLSAYGPAIARSFRLREVEPFVSLEALFGFYSDRRWVGEAVLRGENVGAFSRDVAWWDLFEREYVRSGCKGMAVCRSMVAGALRSTSMEGECRLAKFYGAHVPASAGGYRAIYEAAFEHARGPLLFPAEEECAGYSSRPLESLRGYVCPLAMLMRREESSPEFLRALRGFLGRMTRGDVREAVRYRLLGSDVVDPGIEDVLPRELKRGAVEAFEVVLVYIKAIFGLNMKNGIIIELALRAGSRCTLEMDSGSMLNILSDGAAAGAVGRAVAAGLAETKCLRRLASWSRYNLSSTPELGDFLAKAYGDEGDRARALGVMTGYWEERSRAGLP